MGQIPRDVDAPDPRVNAALQKYLERIDRGESVDVDRFLAEHAEVADELRSFIAASEELARRAAPDAAKVSTSRIARETNAVVPTAGDSPKHALPETFGRYRVQRMLGRGAMGAVYLAHDTQLERQVALKVPSFDDVQSAELLSRFYREARSAATLRNPNICPVYDVGEIDGQHYISMAYIEGRTLSEAIKIGGPQPDRQVLSLVRKLATALQEAHDRGIVHRDLKPGNVMIDAKGEPIVMDFGLACQVHKEDVTRLTHHGVIIGSPAYMSPEQVEGDPTKLTPSADQYSLGVLMYELLTGELPFSGTISAVIAQIGSKAPTPLRQLRPDLDPRVEALVLKMLSKSPKDRLPSMTAVAEQVLAIIKDPPKPAPTETKPPKVAETTASSATEQQRSVQEFVKQGELTAALEALKPLVAKNQGKLAEWAKQQQSQIQADLQRWQHELTALVALAHKLVRKHDYAEARNVLSQIPMCVRTDEIHELLGEAADKDDQCQLLLQDIEEAIRKQFPKELPGLVKQLLQLKPGHQAMQALAAELKQHGPERAIQLRRGQHDSFDPAGRTIEPKHVAYVACGLAILCAAVYFAVITFQTPHGTVVIEVHDPKVTVNLANDEVTAAASGKQFRLKTTEKRTLQVEVDGVTFDSATQEITVAKNETKLITVRLLPDGTPDVRIDREQQNFSVPPKPDTTTKTPTVAVATPRSPAATEAWIDLLAPIDFPTVSSSTRNWRRNGTRVIATTLGTPESGRIYAVLTPPQMITGDYDLEVEFLFRETGPVQFSLPLNETNVTFSVIEGRGTELHWIDDKFVLRNHRLLRTAIRYPARSPASCIISSLRCGIRGRKSLSKRS